MQLEDERRVFGMRNSEGDTVNRLRAVVAGGSLGGLATAIALREAGCEVEVFERSHTKSDCTIGYYAKDYKA